MSTTTTTSSSQRDETPYRQFLSYLHAHFSHMVSDQKNIFETDAEDLWELYLRKIPAAHRQHYTCTCCRQFIQRYGHLAIIQKSGSVVSPLWSLPENVIPREIVEAIRALNHSVSLATIKGPWYADPALGGTLGNPETFMRTMTKPKKERWWHLSVVNLPKHFEYRPTPLTSIGQYMATKRQNYANVSMAICDFSKATLEKAISLLKSEALSRPETVLPGAEWLHGLYGLHPNIVQLKVAQAPDGFCHPRGGMLGLLIDEINAGSDLETIKGKYNAQMSGIKYQRPQAPASAGNIIRAEEIFRKLNLADSLPQVYAQLDEVETIWKSREHVQSRIGELATSGPVFGHLAQKETISFDDPPALRSFKATKITAVKFLATVLPEAVSIKLRFTTGRQNLGAVVRARNLDSEPLLAWDLPGRRNKFSWYLYHNGTSPSFWGLGDGWHKVNAVVNQPNMWYDKDQFKHHGEGFMLVIDKCHSTNPTNLVWFPECLRAELREVRSTIEQYNKSRNIDYEPQGTVCGLWVQKASTLSYTGNTLLVQDKAGIAQAYVVDRWD